MADGIGALLGYDILCRMSDNNGSQRRRGSGATLVEAGHSDSSQSAAAAGGCSEQPHPTATAAAAADVAVDQFEFDVSEFFMLGSPVSLVLAYRQLCSEQHYAGQLSITVYGDRKKTLLVVKGPIILFFITLAGVALAVHHRLKWFLHLWARCC